VAFSHLLSVVVLLSAIPALAQPQSSSFSDSAPTGPTDQKETQIAIAPAEPWNLFANKTFSFRPDTRLDTTVPSREQFSSDSVCYTMRSYVVARDSKDSDSVHPVGYSTCQPASRYRLRTTQIRTLSTDR